MSLNFIKRMIAKKVSRVKPGLLYALKKEELERIKSKPNVYIGKNVTFGEGSSIYTEGEFKKLVIGQDVYLRRYCNLLLYPAATLIIQPGVFINNYCSVNCLGQVEIGEKTIMGEAVKIYDHNHKYHYENDGTLVIEKDVYHIGYVKIGKNCWIGSNVTILDNVEIGDNVIVGANCLIYKSIPSNSVVKHAENLIITQGK